MNTGKAFPIQDNAMETLGGLFRQTRERQRLSLEQIASRTRIQQHHLQALEEEDFASLPAKVFVKGFVRSYARSLGLDEDNAIQLFLTSSSNFYDRTQEEQQHIQVTLQAAHRKRFNWNFVVILFLAIGGILFYLLPEQQEPLPPTPESETPLPINETKKEALLEPLPPIEVSPDSVSSEAPVPTEVQPPSPLPSGITPSPLPPEPQPIAPTFPASPVPEKTIGTDGTLVLEIEATQLTWVVVQSDDQAPHEALLQPGQKSTWKANTQYLLTLGNAAGVVIRLNGELQGPFGKPGQVVRNIRLKP
ncbi:MAG TPA: RodZ domain-containing protein [Nitrospirales bacterium]|nr:RodZ domain-containing protein [Nitrospirales bacterium]